MRYFKKIEGKQIYLSPMNIDDVEIYTKWINDLNITDNLGNSSKVISLHKEKGILEKLSNQDYSFAIILKDEDKLIGNISLFDVNHIHRNATCGLFIGDTENQNKGYGTEALKLLLSYGFNTLNLNNVMLKVFEFNKQAIACYEKVGFKLIGRHRKCYFVKGKYYDELFMDILAKEFFI